MACACKAKKAGQVTAVKQIVKEKVSPATTSVTSNITSKESKLAELTSSATTVRRNVIKRVMFKRHI